MTQRIEDLSEIDMRKVVRKSAQFHRMVNFSTTLC